MEKKALIQARKRLAERGKLLFSQRVESSQYRNRKPRTHRQARKIALEHGIPKECDRCGITWDLNIHHLDRNPENNDPNNLQRLCNSCHRILHWEEDKHIIDRIRENEKFRRLVWSQGINPDYFWRGKR